MHFTQSLQHQSEHNGRVILLQQRQNTPNIRQQSEQNKAHFASNTVINKRAEKTKNTRKCKHQKNGVAPFNGLLARKVQIKVDAFYFFWRLPSVSLCIVPLAHASASGHL